MDNKRGLEIKSSIHNSVHRRALNGKIKPEYYVQCQFSMWVTGWDEWDFCTYDNRMRGSQKIAYTILQKRDNEFMDRFESQILYLLNEWTKQLEQLGFHLDNNNKRERIIAMEGINIQVNSLCKICQLRWQ